MSEQTNPHDPTAVNPVVEGEENPNRDRLVDTVVNTGEDLNPEKPETVEVDTEFVHVNSLDPQRNVPGTSQYLDSVERRRAEILRAKAEGREPDLDNPPAFQGSPLPTVAQAKQVGLDPSLPAAETVEGKVPRLKSEAEGPSINFDANNGPGASVEVNTGVPIP